MPKIYRISVLVFLLCGFTSAKAQFKINCQLGFNSVVNGQLELKDGAFMVYGIFENVPTDSGFHDVNLLQVDNHGNVSKTIKLTDNNEAVIQKMGFRQDGTIYCWIFNKDCNYGIKGNELLLLDSSMTIKSSFLVFESFGLIEMPLFDILPIEGRQWVTTADTSLLILSPIGKTKTRIAINDKIEQILPIGNSKFFLRSKREVLVKDSIEKDYSSSFGENTTGLVKMEDASGLYCLGLESSLVYINTKAEARQTIAASYLKVDRIVDLLYRRDSLHIFALNDGEIVHRVLNNEDELVEQNTIMKLDSGLVFQKVCSWKNGFLLTLKRSIDDQSLDYCVAWKHPAEVRLSHLDLGLESVEIDSIWTERSSVSNPDLVNLEIQGTYMLSNRGRDTISSFQLHGKGLFSEQCNNNLSTTTIDSIKLAPFSTSKFKFSFRDFEVDQTLQYPMCLSVSMPNGEVDSFIFNNNKCEAVGILDATARPVIEFGLYPNPVNQGNDLHFALSNSIQQILIYNARGELMWLGKSEMSINTRSIKKGFYIVKAYDSSGRVYLQKLIVQ